MKFNIRLLYLYLFSFVGLIVVVIGSIQLVNLAMRVTIFKNADTYESYPITKMEGQIVESEADIKARDLRNLERQRERELAQSVSMILVGLPVYMYHWKLIGKEKA